MFSLHQRVRVIIGGRHEAVGSVIGRAFAEIPLYDVRLDDGTTLRNIRLDLADDKNMLTHYIAGPDIAVLSLPYYPT